MPSWYYDQDAFRNTPSIQDGIKYETEYAYRKEGARLIMDIGTQMDLGTNTMATGVVFFHRFYMFQSFTAFPRFVTACCCIFLAGKVEETPKKCKDIIKIAQTLLNEEAFSSFGENPKKEVMTLEKILLQTIKFDLKVEHPYSYLIKYAKHLRGDKNRLHKTVQMAWTFINDSLCTTLCLQWEPEIIAIALMYLASKLSKFKVVSWSNRKANQTKWWDSFVENLEMCILEDICHEVLDLYSSVKDKPQESQPPSQTTKKDPEIKLQNPLEVVKVEKDTQQIQVKTEDQNLCCDSKIPEEVYSNCNAIKLEPPVDSTVAENNIKKEPVFSKVYDQPKPKNILQVAEWASVSASSVMSPGTSSVNSPSFPTPNFLVSPVSSGSFNNRFNESMNQNYIFNNHRNNSVPLNNYQDNLSKSHSGIDSCSDSVPTGSRGFGNYYNNTPSRSRGFDSYEENVPFGNRQLGDYNEDFTDSKHRFKTGGFNKHYRDCDIYLREYTDSKNLYSGLKCSSTMRNHRDPRTKYSPYPKSKSDISTNSFPRSNSNFYENDLNNFERSRSSKQSGRRFKNARRFNRPRNN